MAHDPGSVPLDPGLYEQVVDVLLERRQASSSHASLAMTTRLVEAGDSHAVLADHLRRIIREALAGISGEDRLAQQIELVNRIVLVLNPWNQATAAIVRHPPVLLVDVWPDAQPLSLTKPERPDTPLALGCLLAGTRLDPSLVSQLRKELVSADSVDILCSFIKWSGIRILQQELVRFTQTPRARLRVITTSYLGATDFKAIEFLRRLPNTEVRVSYDTHRTRLHAKAYLFHRHSNFGTAYIGSANLSNPALTDGLEWTVKVSQYESLHLWNRVTATFESYWEDSEFEPYQDADQARLEQALRNERSDERSHPRVFLFDLRPHAFQQEILDRLEAERDVHGRNRHLVVAATGTGKTMIAAFDYKNWSREWFASHGQRPTLLVVAHRMEILEPALHTFRAVLRDPNFGELLVSGAEPTNLDHLFVSIQSYHSRSLADWPADRYAYVVVDEFHHSEAPTYR